MPAHFTRSSQPQRDLMRSARRLRLMAMLGILVGGALGVGVALPANAADIVPYVDPLYPSNTPWYSETEGKWVQHWNAATEADPIKIRATTALNNGAQAVPSSYWAKAKAAVANGTSKFTSTAQVMEQGNLTQYSRTAVLVEEGVIPSAAKGAAAAAELAPKIPMFGVGVLSKVNAVGFVMGAYYLGATTGKAGLKLFGIDSEGVVCSHTGDDLGGKFLQAATLNDCTAFRAAANYVPDPDGATSFGSGSMCNKSLTGPEVLCVIAAPVATIRNDSCTGYTNATFYYVRGTSSGGSAAYPNSSFRTLLTYADGTSSTLIDMAATPAGELNSTGCSTGKAQAKGVAGIKFVPRVISGYSTPLSVDAPVIKESPPRTWETTVIGSNGVHYKEHTVPFKETDSLYPTPPIPILPNGVTPQRLTVDETGGTTPGPVYDQPVDPAYQDLVTTYPECGQGACMLDLITEGDSCFQGKTDCAGWFADPNKETDYKCKYGTHAVALAECTVYADLFKPDGAKISDPQTGAPLAGASAPSSDSPVMDNGVEDSSQPRNCFPTGWAVLNPVEWVVRPVQCALEWAFVPRAAIVGEITSKFDAGWKASTPVRLATAIGAVMPAGGDDTSCRGIAVDLSWIPQANVGVKYFLPACPGDFFAPIAPPFKILIGISFIISGFFGLTRHVGGVFGYGGLGGEK